MLQFLQRLWFGNLEPVRSFTCFSLLPVELQLEIWRFALPESRIVELIFWRDRFSTVTTARCEEINLLYTCQNSRFVARQVYRRMEAKQIDRPFYISASNDILLIGNLPDTLEPFCQLPVVELTGCVSVLALQVWLPQDSLSVPAICDAAAKIGSLKEVVIVLSPIEGLSFESHRSLMAFMQGIRNKLIEVRMAEAGGNKNSDRGASWQIPKIQLVKSTWLNGPNNFMAIEQALLDWNKRRALEKDHN